MTVDQMKGNGPYGNQGHKAQLSQTAQQHNNISLQLGGQKQKQALIHTQVQPHRKLKNLT